MGINGARYVAMIRGLVGIFMFGVQTFFISKSIGYLLRVALFSFDNNLLDQEIFLIFFMGMNIIDGIAFFITLLFQFWLFSSGISKNRSFINFSAYFVYFGLILFLIIIVSENYHELSNTLILSINIDNVIAKNNLVPLVSIAGTLCLLIFLL